MQAFLQNLISRFPKKSLLVVLYILWTVSIIGVVDNLAGRYAITLELARNIITFMALVGGLIIITVSYFPNYRFRYTNTDRFITFILVFVTSYALFIFPVASNFLITGEKKYIVWVQSTKTSLPINKATVSVELPGMPALHNITDDEGKAIFELKDIKSIIQVRIIAEAYGYTHGEKQIILKESDESSFIFLQPK